MILTTMKKNGFAQKNTNANNTYVTDQNVKMNTNVFFLQLVNMDVKIYHDMNVKDKFTGENVTS